nr:unnamed protein product [Spirometra erinaceieuropaei]
MARPQNTALARSYALPKVHKDGAPLRPIVSLKGTTTYGLTKWLFRRLKFLTAELDTTVSSSAEFLEKLKGASLHPNEDLTIEIIELLPQSKYDETENHLRHVQILQLLKLCLRTHFTFDGIIYEQVQCTPMGLSISGFITEAVLQRLESLVFQHHRPKFCARYVDDTFVVIERDQVLTFQEHLNAVFPDIQFTMEEEENNQLAFLDVFMVSGEDYVAGTAMASKVTLALRIKSLPEMAIEPFEEDACEDLSGDIYQQGVSSVIKELPIPFTFAETNDCRTREDQRNSSSAPNLLDEFYESVH